MIEVIAYLAPFDTRAILMASMNHVISSKAQASPRERVPLRLASILPSPRKSIPPIILTVLTADVKYRGHKNKRNLLSYITLEST